MTKFRAAGVAVFGIIALSQLVHARQVKWSNHELLVSKSDAIVIASPVVGGAAECDLSKDLDWADYLTNAEFAKKLSMMIRGQQMTFKVHATLKGSIEAKEVQVVYPVADRELDFIINGPILVEQSCLKVIGTLNESASLSHVFLLFLKKRSDGIYIPVSGLLDSGFSFQRLDVPPIIQLK